jgi:hypothetical protein
MALDNSGATSNGGEVHQWAVESGNSNQEWQLVPVQIGANTPFTSYEAESGTLSGGATVVSLTTKPTTEFSSPQLEASGHAYVHLAATGQSVTWTNNTGKTSPSSMCATPFRIPGRRRHHVDPGFICQWHIPAGHPRELDPDLDVRVVEHYDGMNKTPSSGTRTSSGMSSRSPSAARISLPAAPSR